MTLYNYFKPYKDYFWEWDKDRSNSNEDPIYIATITNGQSIAYFDVISDTLEDLSPQGIPPFGSILLILSAISNTVLQSSFDLLKNTLLNKYGENDKSISNAIEVLELIRALPNNYKSGETRTELLQLLFKDCHNRLGLKKSNELKIEVKKGLNEYIVNAEKSQINNSIIDQDIRPIALLIRRFKSTEDIINAIHKIPIHDNFTEEITIEEHISSDIDFVDKTFLEQLIEHENTFQIGSLIKRIWPGLNIPMHNNFSSSQPLGGVSDITNKGEFSRLLISEFAHDNDTFMSRIVNNEALYIERETPPENNTKERIFLIDNSLKNWGIPKVLSFATALAIATHPKSDFSYSVYAVGETYTETPLHTRFQVTESQYLLSGSLHCASGLQAFLEENTNDASREIFFLTEENNLNNSNLQNVIYKNYNAINYIITNTINGDINFYKHQNKNRKHFQHILLPYQDIWNSQLPKPTVQKPLKNEDIQIKNLLLEPINKSDALIIPFENEIYCIQKQNLYTLTSKGIYKGVQLIYENIPFDDSNKFTVIKNDNDERILIAFSNIIKQTYRLNLKTKELTNTRIYKKALENNVLLVFNANNTTILTNKTNFWSLSKEFKLHKLTGNARYHELLFNYQEAISNFKRLLKVNKLNYNILKNISVIDIEYSGTENLFLRIANFYLQEKRFVTKENTVMNYRPSNTVKAFTPKTTLYLKYINGSPLHIIKHLKDILNIGLKEAKTIVDSIPSYPIKNNLSIKKAKSLKTKIESLDAVCYIKTDYFETNDGSTIYIENGQLIFRSSNTKIPQFYITSILGFDIAMATDGEFAGNEYFLPVNHKLTTISLDNFYTKYINPFIKHVLTYED